MVKFIIVVTLFLSGCGHFTQMKNVNIDNTTVNNYIGNPCGFYLGDRCLYIKPSARNPDSPIKREQNVK